jgi:hypothetical protein
LLLREAVPASGRNDEPGSTFDRKGAIGGVLGAMPPQIQEHLVEVVHVFAEAFDSRHVLIQSESPQTETGSRDFIILQQDGLQLLGHDKNDTGFVLMQTLFF